MKKLSGIVFPILLLFLSSCGDNAAKTTTSKDSAAVKSQTDQTANNSSPNADSARYNSLMTYLANGDTTGRWPVKG